MHELWCYHESQWHNITGVVGNLSWKSSINELAVTMDFDVAYSDAGYFTTIPIAEGDVISLKNGDEIFKGIILTENINGRSARKYTACDFAFYLNKSKETYQFNRMNAGKAIRKICSGFDVPVSYICPLTSTITKIYTDKPLSDIIKDILGDGYYMEMRPEGLYINKPENITISGVFSFAENLSPTPINKLISNPQVTRSIEAMKNSIKIISGDEKGFKVLKTVKDNTLINRYGLLQDVIKLEKGQDAVKVANSELEKLARVSVKSSLELLGDDNVRAGRYIELVEHITGINGVFLIESASHTLAGGVHKMKIDLG